MTMVVSTTLPLGRFQIGFLSHSSASMRVNRVLYRWTTTMWMSFNCLPHITVAASVGGVLRHIGDDIAEDNQVLWHAFAALLELDQQFVEQNGNVEDPLFASIF